MPGILARASSIAGSRSHHPPAGWADVFLLTCLLLISWVTDFYIRVILKKIYIFDLSA